MNLDAKVYTPEQVATMLQLSKNTVYDLIRRGEIIAKRIGKVYRIPADSLSFIFTGLDHDLYQKEQEDLKNQPKIRRALSKTRIKLWLKK
ncbi:MAG: DNA-binding protein, excisionase family [Candidatus Curtissbacteria bacterium GW2011_GWA1_41_11]|uniref:DNA-binding protein, excisionase family n=1 Tax=Candidatus Curtissbacteria bacterium GW2011_GWA1_41_11 TaxID=1618409 RepID=A0A0G0UGY3_9BACT|nr:MAG: DNA-binding protein, excisionase family [Candidatus Curtissbacteria bacterium GW2011_GWA1_41_11]